MYDLERIGKIIVDTKKYLKELESYKLKLTDLQNSKNYNAASMLVFAILNRIIDLGNEIISAENLGAPNIYKDIMNILAKGNIINQEQADKMNKLIVKRNMFAHFYGEITKKELFDTIQNMADVENFMRTIQKRIKL